MPNIAGETGINDAPWERLRAAMIAINADRCTIRNAERRIAGSTMEIYHILWPRTDNTNSLYVGAEKPSIERKNLTS